MRAQRSYKARPSAVSESLRVVRCSSFTRSCASSDETRALTADFETPSFLAAKVNERASTTRAKNTSETISSGEAATAATYHDAATRTPQYAGRRSTKVTLY